jgi:hypothetical protein
MLSKMPSRGSSAPALVYCLILCFGTIAEFVYAETGPLNLIGNGNFEDLVGYFPAGVLVRRSRLGRHVVIPHWNVSERCAPVEIISSRFWQSSISSAARSLYAVHLNTRAGPGGIQQEFPSPWNNTNFGSGTARYELIFDVAANPSGGSSVKNLEVILSPSECLSHKLSLPVASNANSKRLDWKTQRLVLEVQGSEPTVTLQFQSLTPGAYGPLIDNVRLSPLQSDDADNDSVAAENGAFCKNGNEDEEMELRRARKSAVQHLLERARMSAETWIRQRFLRPEDW